MLDGVEPVGRLHWQRMFDAFYRRMTILSQTVTVLACASMRADNQEAVQKHMRRLNEMLFPEDSGKRMEQEEMMRDVLRREGVKSYKVRKVKLGER